MLNLARISGGTAFAMPQQAINVFEGLVLDGQARMSRAGSFDWQVWGVPFIAHWTILQWGVSINHIYSDTIPHPNHTRIHRHRRLTNHVTVCDPAAYSLISCSSHMLFEATSSLLPPPRKHQ
jgi:hypothetical protein